MRAAPDREMPASHDLAVLFWPTGDDVGANPYVSLLANSLRSYGVRIERLTPLRVLAGRAQVVHMQWPDWTLRGKSAVKGAARVIALGLLLAVSRLRGLRIVWTVHNLHPHGHAGGRLERLLYGILNWFVDVQIHLSSDTAVQMVAEGHPAAGKRHLVVPHGLYGSASPVPLQAHDIAPPTLRGVHTFGFLGTVSEYKGLPELLSAFGGGSPDWHLLIAGKPDTPACEIATSNAAARDERITTLLRWISEGEYSAWLMACDVLVLPYRRVLNSGSVFMALEAGIPVLVPAAQVFVNLRQEVGAGWVTTFNGKLKSADLARALKAASHLKGEKPDLSGRDWADIAKKTLAAYALAFDRASAGVTTVRVRQGF